MNETLRHPPAAAPDDPRRRAVATRDAAADGTFVYAVRTTGVYCRPSCAARRARPENVAFYATPADAIAAGFRACKRCTPDAQANGERHAATVAAACRTIEAGESPPALAALAKHAGMSAFHFHRLFKALTGLTPKGYASAFRAAKVRERLAGGGSVTDAAYDAGYGSNGRFYAETSDALGMTPTSFKRGGARATIRFAIGASSLGALLVARSAIGVCAISLGDDPDALARDLQDRFPHAELVGGDAGFEELVARVAGLVEAPQTGLELPLDIRGTAFQQRVWHALRAIPAGTTVSYRELAERAGRPGAARAVARACAANLLAVAIPCHRVVRRDGELSGYRWGVERKRLLLDREAP